MKIGASGRVAPLGNRAHHSRRGRALPQTPWDALKRQNSRDTTRGIHERYPTVGARAWKSFDWEALNRLHGKGLISDPVSKARSVVLTETGLGQAESAFHRLFDD